MTPNFLLSHVPQAVKSMSEEMKVCGGSENEVRKGVCVCWGGGMSYKGWQEMADWLRLITNERISFASSFFALFLKKNCPVLLKMRVCPSPRAHTHPLCHRPTRRVETSSDLANNRSINGAVKHVTQASQNLLRSNSPLQLPLHWSNPWATTSKRTDHTDDES